MARSTFGGTASDFVTTASSGGLLRLASAVLTFWDAPVGGNRHTDLLLDGTATSAIQVGSNGQIPAFEGPDGVTSLWVDDGDNQRARLVAEGKSGPVGPEGAPGGSDPSFAGWINDTASQTRGALNDTFVGRWQAGRAYSVGDIASTSDGTLIERTIAGTSAATYAADAANWKVATGLVTVISERMGVSIKDYPRVGTEADDMPRFRRALDAIEAKGGGRLLVPWVAGGYTFAFVAGSTITSPTRLLVRTSNVEVLGFGMPTINMTGLTTAYLFSIDDYASSGRDIFTAFSFAGVSNCHASGIKFAGEYGANEVFRYQSPRAIAVAFKGATNCSATGLEGQGLLGNLVNVVNSYISYDAPFANSENVTVADCHAEHCLENGVNYMGGTLNCVASNLTATDCANGLESATDGFTLNGAIFTGNRASGLALSGKRMTINGLVATSSKQVIGGVTDNGKGYGVVITGGQDIQFNGGKFNDNHSFGIYLYPGVKDVTFIAPEVRRNAINATDKVSIQMVGLSTNRIQRITFLGGDIEATGTVTGGIPNFTDDVRIVDMKGTFGSSSSFSFAADCNGSHVANNRFDKPVTMNDPTGEAYNNGLYRRVDRSSVPTTGTWLAGDIINNTSRTQGGIAEWSCIQGGTFGTLNGGATTASTTAGSAAVTVSSATGLYRGAWITIAGVSGTRIVAAVSGTNVTLTTTTDATVTGAAVAYRNPVIIPAKQNGPKTSIAAAPDYIGQHAAAGGHTYVATSTSSAAGWKPYGSSSGTTGTRPSATTVGIGAMFFDTTLGRPIWSNGTAWVDATGATV